MKKYCYSVIVAAAMAASVMSCGPKKSTDSENSSAKVDSSNLKEEAAMMTSKHDESFAEKAGEAGMLEITLGKVALAKNVSAQTKEMAQMIVTDHTKAADELTAMAMKRNIHLPESLSKKNQDVIDRLSKKDGAEFDKDYASQMVTDHEDAVALFKKEAEAGDDNEMKTWALGIVPTLEHHLEMAHYAEKTKK